MLYHKLSLFVHSLKGRGVYLVLLLSIFVFYSKFGSRYTNSFRPGWPKSMATVVRRVAKLGGGFTGLALTLSKIVNPFMIQLQKLRTDELIGNERFGEKLDVVFII